MRIKYFLKLILSSNCEENCNVVIGTLLCQISQTKGVF